MRGNRLVLLGITASAFVIGALGYWLATRRLRGPIARAAPPASATTSAAPSADVPAAPSASAPKAAVVAVVPSVDAQIGPVSTTSPVVDAAATVATLRPAFRRCWAAHGPPAYLHMTAKMWLELGIGAKGNVTRAVRAGGSLPSVELEQCALREARAATFEAPGGAGSTMQFYVLFVALPPSGSTPPTSTLPGYDPDMYQLPRRGDGSVRTPL